MSKVIHLASGALTRAGDTLSIELHRPLDSPSFVMVVWPAETLSHRTHRPVNPRPPGRLRQRRDRVTRRWSGVSVQAAGLMVTWCPRCSSWAPVVGCGLRRCVGCASRRRDLDRAGRVQHPVGGDHDRVRDGDLGPAHPAPFTSRACWTAR